MVVAGGKQRGRAGEACVFCAVRLDQHAAVDGADGAAKVAGRGAEGERSRVRGDGGEECVWELLWREEGVEGCEAVAGVREGAGGVEGGRDIVGDAWWRREVLDGGRGRWGEGGRFVVVRVGAGRAKGVDGRGTVTGLAIVWVGAAAGGREGGGGVGVGVGGGWAVAALVVRGVLGGGWAVATAAIRRALRGVRDGGEVVGWVYRARGAILRALELARPFLQVVHVCSCIL